MNPHNKKSFADFISAAHKIWKGFYQYEMIGNYVNTKEKNIKAKCPIHGYFLTSYSNHINSKRGCRECGINKRGFHRRLTKENALLKLKEALKLKPELSEVKIEGIYRNSFHKNVIVTCKEHGEYKTSLNSVIHQKSGCPTCAKVTRENFAANNRNGFKKFIDNASRIHQNKYSYRLIGEYRNGRTLNIIVSCREHGDFATSYNRHITNKNGCSKCAKAAKMSKGERELSEFFRINKITYEQEWNPPGLKGISNRKLWFDFYLPEKNAVVEFHGGQHNKIGIGKLSGLLSTIKNDLLKEKFAWKKGIKYFVVRDFHLDDLRSVLNFA